MGRSIQIVQDSITSVCLNRSFSSMGDYVHLCAYTNTYKYWAVLFKKVTCIKYMVTMFALKYITALALSSMSDTNELTTFWQSVVKDAYPNRNQYLSD